MNIKENIGVYLLLTPLFSYMSTLFSVALVGSFVDGIWLKENINNDASGIFIIWNFIFATVFLTVYIIEKLKEHD